MSFIINPYDHGAVAPISLIANIGAGLGQNGGTTSSIDTSGADLLVVALAYFSGGSPTLSDSKSNSYTPLTKENAFVLGGGFDTRLRLYYCAGATVGSGHTFTVSGAEIYCSIAVEAFSNTHSSPFDDESGTSDASGSTVQPGSISPAGNNEVFVTAMLGEGTTESINSSFVETDAVDTSGGSHQHLCMAYKIQTTGGAENPTWTHDGDDAAAVMAAFKNG